MQRYREVDRDELKEYPCGQNGGSELKRFCNKLHLCFSAFEKLQTTFEMKLDFVGLEKNVQENIPPRKLS